MGGSSTLPAHDVDRVAFTNIFLASGSCCSQAKSTPTHPDIHNTLKLQQNHITKKPAFRLVLGAPLGRLELPSTAPEAAALSTELQGLAGEILPPLAGGLNARLIPARAEPARPSPPAVFAGSPGCLSRSPAWHTAGACGHIPRTPGRSAPS